MHDDTFVALMCISLAANSIECFLRCLPATCMSASVKCMFMYLTHFLIRFLFFIMLSFEGSLYILNAYQFSDAGFANIFPNLLFVSLSSS